MTSTHDVESVERVIAAPPEKIFELLADPSRHHEIDGSGSVKEAKEGSTRLALGDRFGMSMKVGVSDSMVSEVIEFDENRRIAWQTWPPNDFAAKLAGGRIWRYELEPVDGGTLVRESWDISQERVKFVVRPSRGKTKKAMEATLERIEQVVTA
jgi:uncharacterized protein YndB with AHSA1/START domain